MGRTISSSTSSFCSVCSVCSFVCSFASVLSCGSLCLCSSSSPSVSCFAMLTTRIMGCDSSITMSPPPKRVHSSRLPSEHKHASTASKTVPPATSIKTNGGGSRPSLMAGTGNSWTATPTASAIRWIAGPIEELIGCRSRAPQTCIEGLFRSIWLAPTCSPPFAATGSSASFPLAISTSSSTSSMTFRTLSAVSMQQGTLLEHIKWG
mmetsp:Transcript_7550/g.15670  ORF Transcript_7550/g.15670 Transcript_7550/m.15670 type:complete len:207 (-) Transcript_7550:745-1365(-)